MKISKRYHLRARERKELTHNLSKVLTIDFPQINTKKVRTEVLELSDGKQIIVLDNLPSFIIEDNVLFPALLNAEVLTYFPIITVDSGAVPYICNGADLMAPGITKFTGTFNEGDIIIINEERHNQPLAIGRSLLSSSQLKNTHAGKVALNLHYVGDPIWIFLKNL
jgi:PUA domain protein